MKIFQKSKNFWVFSYVEEQISLLPPFFSALFALPQDDFARMDLVNMDHQKVNDGALDAQSAFKSVCLV